MKKLLITLASIILVSLILASSTSGAIMHKYSVNVNARTKGLPTAWKGLHVEGKWIVNEEGRVVSLRGANFPGYERLLWQLHGEEDYAKMASWGFNVVRLPIAWHYIEPTPGVYNGTYLSNYVDKDIAWAKKYGIYIILDMGQWHWSSHFWFDGNGMPTWLVSGYPSNYTGEMQAKKDFWLGKGPNGTDTNPSMQDRFISAWKFVASKYANESTICAYDLLNEPVVELLPGLTSTELTDLLYSFYSRAITGIRKVDQRHIILYEAWSFWVDEMGRIPLQARVINQSNIALKFHFYCLRGFYNGIANDLKALFDSYYWNPVKDLVVPVFVGEFGTRTEYPNATLWLRDLVNILEGYKLGWTYCSYGRSDKDTMFLLRADGTPREEWLQYLRRV